MSRPRWAATTGGLLARCTRSVSTVVDIDRPAAGVWAVLTDFDRYPEWNPQIRRAEGDLAPGRRVTFQLDPPIGPPVQIRPRVPVVDPERELRLRGSLPGTFSGEHWFELAPISDGRGTRLTQGETSSSTTTPR